jgi:hypothetical protein
VGRDNAACIDEIGGDDFVVVHQLFLSLSHTTTRHCSSKSKSCYVFHPDHNSLVFVTLNCDSIMFRPSQNTITVRVSS